jgi:hypoxanthine phosphoribosyltransferase
MSKTYLTWENIQEDTKILGDKLKSFNFSCIVGIANGGMIPATLLAKHLKVNKLLSANLKSYQQDVPRNGAHSTEDIVKVISFPSWGDLQNEDNVLIVDDLVDTGLTLQKIKKIEKIINWERSDKKTWVYATIYYKPKTIFVPDYTVKEFDNDEWIVFPWEN